MDVRTQSSNYVIAINEASGAEKTLLMRALSSRLEDVVTLRFDDYNPKAVASTRYPAYPVQWIANGADPNEWETPQLAQDLYALRRGKAIQLPANKGRLEPKRFILLEEPFGRGRREMKELIDVVIAIDTPLEVALARRILRTGEQIYYQDNPEELAKILLEYTRVYLGVGRDLHIAINSEIHRNCDLVLDGMRTVEELAEEAATWIKTHLVDQWS